MDKRSDIKQLFEEYKGCLRCPDLCTRRTKVVFGEGGINANLMIIGEPPGAYEDKVGFPLRGEAGSLLDEIFTPLGISRQYDVYITSMVLCRPSYDEDTDEGIKRKPRSPTRDELLACNPRLMQEIYIVDPKIIRGPQDHPAARRESRDPCDPQHHHQGVRHRPLPRGSWQKHCQDTSIPRGGVVGPRESRPWVHGGEPGDTVDTTQGSRIGGLECRDVGQRI